MSSYRLYGYRISVLIADCLVLEFEWSNPNGVGVLFSEAEAGVANLKDDGAALPEYSDLGTGNQTEGLEAGHKARGSGKFGNRVGVSLETGGQG